MKWSTVKFETLYLESSKNGIYKSKEFHGDGTRIVNMGDLFGNSFIGNQEMSLLQLTASELKRFRLQNGDLLFARRSLVEEGAGKCVLVVKHDEPMVFESSIIRVRLNPEFCNPRFYYYYFQSPIGRNRIKSIVTGVAQKGIRGAELKNILVHNPKKPIQNEIAKILSAYDDLIANNSCRMELLEESMRLLFHEWFVLLHFPGYQRENFINGVPGKWTKTIIDDAFEIFGGGTPSKKVDEYWAEGDINWFTPTDLTKSHLMFIDESSIKTNSVGISKSSAKLFPAYSVMMTSRATIGEIAINTVEASTNQGFITCIPNEQIPLYFLYNWLSENVTLFQNIATGATFKEITKGVFRKLPIIIPQKSLLQEFEKAVYPMAEQVHNLQRQNKKLAQARNELLPRLMNGSIPV